MTTWSPIPVENTVNTSNVIGYVGTSGGVPAHLHFEISTSSDFTTIGFDPEAFLN